MREMIVKELCKIRVAFYLFTLFSLFCIVWIFFDIRGDANRYGISFYTLQVMFNKKFSFNHLDEINILFAVVFGFCSMFYERYAGRIRVQFHYPHSYFQNIATLVAIPLCFLLFIYMIQILAMFFVLKIHFANEISLAIMSTLFYSALFGVGLFLSTQSIVIEPNLKNAFSIVCINLATLFLYFKINPDVCNSSLYYLNEKLWLYLLIYLCATLCLVVNSLNNYKKGYIK